MERRFFIKALVSVGASIGLRQVIPDAWAFENGINNAPSRLKQCGPLAPAKGGSPFLELFEQELNKYPKSSWAHSIERIEVIPNPRTYVTHVVRGISSHPSTKEKKGFNFEISSVDAFINDPKRRKETVAVVVSTITMAWRKHRS